MAKNKTKYRVWFADGAFTVVSALAQVDELKRIWNVVRVQTFC